MDSATSQGQSQRKLRILCLHGWRTSGKILSMQTAAMQYHTPLEYHFVTAPHAAEGPPDSGIGIYYPNHTYFEWYLKSMSNDGHYAGLDESIKLVLSTLIQEGPFDGILGFSQGAAMATRLAQLQHSTDQKLFSFLILMGGVPPLDLPKKGRDLLHYYDSSSSTVLEHEEGHNIPSMRTGLYPQISEWVNTLAL
eukprot:gene14493-16638_t